MKLPDPRLQRLIEAAAKAPFAHVEVAPPGLESRVLANWRAGRGDDESASLFAVFRHAMVGASLVLVLSAAWSLSRPTSNGAVADEAVRLNYNIQMSLNP